MKFDFILLAAFWLFALFNPVFKKYDYGAGFPLVILFAVILLAIFLKYRREKCAKSRAEKLALGGFCVAVVISFVLSQTRNFGLSEVMAYLSVAAFYLFYAYREIEWKEKFLNFVMLSGIAAAVFGFIMFFISPEVRMYGPFFNILYHSNVWPNAFALFILMVWPLVLINKKSTTFTKTAFLGIFFAALFLTYSRGAMIAFAGQIILMTIFFLRSIKLKWLLYAAVTVMIASVLAFGATYIRSLKYDVVNVSDRIEFANNEGLTSKQERVDFWEGAIRLIKEKPFFGWGPFSFRYAYNPIQKDLLASSDHPHNLFLKIGAENGGIALAFFLMFLIIFVFNVFAGFSRLKKEQKRFTLILAVAAAGAFAHNMIDYNFNFMVNLFLLFAMMAFMRSGTSRVKNSGAFFTKFLIIILAVCGIYEGGILFASRTLNNSYLSYSMFPRLYFLDSGEISKDLELNPLDPQAYHLKGVSECENGDFENCKLDLSQAISLDPLNDFSYYDDYMRYFPDSNMAMKVEPLLEKYFTYVEENVHFTAYTQNVEAAAELASFVSPLLSADEGRKLLDSSLKMLSTARELRNNKTY